MNKITVVLILLLCIILCAGCTASDQPKGVKPIVVENSANLPIETDLSAKDPYICLSVEQLAAKLNAQHAELYGSYLIYEDDWSTVSVAGEHTIYRFRVDHGAYLSPSIEIHYLDWAGGIEEINVTCSYEAMTEEGFEEFRRYVDICVRILYTSLDEESVRAHTDRLCEEPYIESRDDTEIRYLYDNIYSYSYISSGTQRVRFGPLSANNSANYQPIVSVQ